MSRLWLKCWLELALENKLYNLWRVEQLRIIKGRAQRPVQKNLMGLGAGLIGAHNTVTLLQQIIRGLTQHQMQK